MHGEIIRNGEMYKVVMNEDDDIEWCDKIDYCDAAVAGRVEWLV